MQPVLNILYLNVSSVKGKTVSVYSLASSIVPSTRKGQNMYVLNEQGQEKGCREERSGPPSSQPGTGLPPLEFWRALYNKISHWVRMKIHTQTSWRNRPAHEIKTQPVRKQASKRQEAGRHTVLSPDNGTFATAFPGDRHYQRRTLTWMWCIFLPVPIQYLSPLPFLSKPAISDPQHLSAAKSLKGLISKKDAPGLCYQSYLILHLPWA